jgi:hypothetical protein
VITFKGFPLYNTEQCDSRIALPKRKTGGTACL